jgi:hypothetical protein
MNLHVTVSPNAAGVSGRDEPDRSKHERLNPSAFFDGVDSASLASESINRPHPSPHLCRMIGIRGYIHHAVIDSDRDMRPPRSTRQSGEMVARPRGLGRVCGVGLTGPARRSHGDGEEARPRAPRDVNG